MTKTENKLLDLRIHRMKCADENSIVEPKLVPLATFADGGPVGMPAAQPSEGRTP